MHYFRLNHANFAYFFREYDEADEYCPHCDNHYILPAVTPDTALGLGEGTLAAVKESTPSTTDAPLPALPRGFLDPRMIRPKS
jgi:hypothetical protein